MKTIGGEYLFLTFFFLIIILESFAFPSILVEGVVFAILLDFVCSVSFWEVWVEVLPSEKIAIFSWISPSVFLSASLFAVLLLLNQI